MRQAEILEWAERHGCLIRRVYHARGNYWCVAGEAVTREVEAMLKNGLLKSGQKQSIRGTPSQWETADVTEAGRKLLAEARAKQLAKERRR